MKKIIPLILGKYLNTLALIWPALAAKHGFRMFCHPFRSPMRHYHHKFLASAKKSNFTLDDITIQVYQWGSGPRQLLFLHGWQSHSFRWKSYIEKLAGREFTIYALDAPGHGLSSGSFLTVPLYSKAVEKFIHLHGPIDTLVAHSLGAFTALYTLHRLPLLPINKLGLLASPGEATEFFEFYKHSLKLSERAAGLIRKHFQYVIEAPVEFFSAPKFAEGLPHSGLLIHDEYDDETFSVNSVLIHEAWQRSRLILTKNLGHNLKSPEIIEEVKNFIGERKISVLFESPESRG